MQQALLGIHGDTPTASPQYNSLIGVAGWGSETSSCHTVATPGTISELRVVVAAAPGVGKTLTFTLRVNGADTALTTTISGGVQTSDADLAHSVNVFAGDIVCISLSYTFESTLSAIKYVSKFSGSVAGECNILGSNSQGTNKTYYQPIQGFTNSLSLAEDSGNKSYAPTGGNFTHLRVNLSVAPAGAQTISVTLRKNGADTGITLTITGADTTGSVTANVAAAQGDYFTIKVVSSVTAAATIVRWGLIFAPTVDGEAPYFNVRYGALDTANPTYNRIGGGDSSWVSAANESTRQQISLPITYKKLYVILNGSPGAGKSYAYTLRSGGADKAVTCTIADANVSAADNVNTYDAAVDELITIECTPAGTPTARMVDLSIVGVMASSSAPKPKSSNVSQLVALGVI